MIPANRINLDGDALLVGSDDAIENSFVGIMPAATEAHVQSIRVRKDYQKLMRTLACFVDGFKD